MTDEGPPYPDMSGITVLQILPSLELGGAERSAVDVAGALVEAGATSLVASAGGPMVAELEAGGSRHLPFPAATKNPLHMLANVGKLARLVRAEGVDLLHARSRAPAWSALLAARRTGIPFVTTYHAQVHEGPALKRLYNSSLVRGSAVIANSSFNADRIRRVHNVPEARVITIPRGVDLARFDPALLDPSAVARQRADWVGSDAASLPILLLPARFTRWKGQLVAVAAAAELVRCGVRDFRLVLVGDAQGRDDYVAELKGAIEASGLGGQVLLSPSPDDMPTALAAADIVLAPSIDPEPFGRVPIEAQAMQRPVVASDAGGAVETVVAPEDGGGAEAATGRRVPPGAPAGLADALADLLALPEAERQAMGQRGREHVAARYSMRAMCSATLALYRRLLADRNARERV